VAGAGEASGEASGEPSGALSGESWPEVSFLAPVSGTAVWANKNEDEKEIIKNTMDARPRATVKKDEDLFIV
jgi:hypothetical protein